MRSSQTPRRPSPSRRRSSTAGTLLAVGIAVALPVAALASFHHANPQRPGAGSARPVASAHLQAGAIITPRATSAAWSVSYPVQLPAGYQAPTGIAADPAASGVWFFAQGGTSAKPLDTVFYWSSVTGRLSRYQLDAADPALQAGAQTPIVVTGATAWIGDNRTLVSVNRKTGVIGSRMLPAVSIAGRNTLGLPVPPAANKAQAQAFTDIDALALAPGGSVVIGRRFATELQAFSPASRKISSLRLPKNTELPGLGADIAGQGRGEIAAALYEGQGQHELGQLGQHGWKVSQGTCPAYAVAMTGASLAVTGPGCAAAGAVSSTGAAARLAVQPSAEAGSGEQACAVPLRGGQVALCAPSGIAVAPAGAQAAVAGAAVALGEIVRAPSGQPDGNPGGAAANGLAATAITPGLMAPAANGTLWFVPAQGGTAIGLLTRR